MQNRLIILNVYLPHKIFSEAFVDKSLPEDYISSLKVIKHYFGKEKFENKKVLDVNDEIYLFWNFCKLNAIISFPLKQKIAKTSQRQKFIIEFYIRNFCIYNGGCTWNRRLIQLGYSLKYWTKSYIKKEMS